MDDLTADSAARRRFREEYETNFAVNANAGSGKTTAISERLAHLALTAAGSALLPRMVVVTFTKKAAAQMRQRARAALLSALARRRAGGQTVPARALEMLDHAFFGTIHSFCLLLGQRYGASYGLNLNPTVLDEDDDELWEQFIEQDGMRFSALPEAGVRAFLRFLPLEEVFTVARKLNVATAGRFLNLAPRTGPPLPDERVLERIQSLEAKGRGRSNIEATKRAAAEWVRRFGGDHEFLPMLCPAGTGAAVVPLVQELTAPLKNWLAAAAGALAAELALRYREFRMERGVQTYADQVEAALAVLQQDETLNRIRGEGYRVLLDEAQDTDPRQFAVLVEIARPPGAAIGDWPGGGGPPPRPGHFSMVGDGQQAIYGSRADVRQFLRYLGAFERKDGGEQLDFSVTFRAPERIVAFCNGGFASAFGEGVDHNFNVSPRRRLQVLYSPLVAAPGNDPGRVSRLPLEPVPAKLGVEPRLLEEVRQIARVLQERGPAAMGARAWGDICLLAPRNDWLITARKALEEAGLKVALQMRRNRNADHPVYAWLSGLLAVACDPDNAFEWVGALREVFGVSDALIAESWGANRAFHWDDPGRHPDSIAAALRVLAPLIAKVDEEGTALEGFLNALVDACALREKARLIDPSGGYEAELDRLCGRAGELSRNGWGPRELVADLLAHREEGRPAGKPADDAINLLTSYSAKGLEWPVVIPFGLWRRLREPPEKGLRLLGPGDPEAQLFFDSGSVPSETTEARRRERLRENTRLLYVTFTRARRHLVLPWHPEFAPDIAESFAALWGATGLFDRLPEISAVSTAEWAPTQTTESVKAAPTVGTARGEGKISPAVRPAAPALPLRLLPHQLAGSVDPVRSGRHESMLDEPGPGAVGDDPIGYGLWWHETMEFLPWHGDEKEIESFVRSALGRAHPAGFGTRAEQELARLRASGWFEELRTAKTELLTELAVFARLRPGAWIDGVVDLVILDRERQVVRVIDWKTNRPRPGEADDVLLERLCRDYQPQLAAYGTCLAGFFPGFSVRLEIYGSAAGGARALASA